METERCGQRTKNTGRRKDAGSRSPLTTPPRHAPHNTQTPADNCLRSVSTDHLQHILTTKSAAGTPQQPSQTSAVNCGEQGTPAARLPKPRTTADLPTAQLRNNTCHQGMEHPTQAQRPEPCTSAATPDLYNNCLPTTVRRPRQSRTPR